MKDFRYWDNLHRNENLEEFSSDRTGLLWLKTKSIVRKELIEEFIQQNEIKLNQTALKQQFVELFNLLSKDIDKSNMLLDDYIKEISNQQIANVNIPQLVSELYKLKNFEWGGDYQNSLDKYLVSRYVKVQNPSFDYLMSKFETEINPAVQGYVLNSWYNYWRGATVK